MIIATAKGITEELGPLSRIVAEFCALIESRATGKGVTAADWAPLEELVDVKTFKRVGAYLEEMNWDEYIAFLTRWAGGTRFETTVHRISEVGRAVFYEIEERHYRGDAFVRKNVIAVYDFDDKNRIRHLDIYEQAKDSGQWIVEAVRAAAATP
jgi:limonene-1,2-epoxide hydrolase